MQHVTETDYALKAIFEESCTLPEANRKFCVRKKIKTAFGHVLPESLLEILTSYMFDGDTGISMDVKPDWLDMEKFRKGQQFAKNYYFNISYAELLSLTAMYSLQNEIRPLIASGASSTPYTAFVRFLSTVSRIRNWYTSDPWTPNTPAYNDIKMVRRAHAIVRKRMNQMTDDEIKEKTKFDVPWCPMLEVIREDFKASCPAPVPGQYPQVIYNKYVCRGKKLNQGNMTNTQFTFVCFAILDPKFLGIHGASDDDLEAFCHVWRGIGYLLGVDDDFNFCRGSLEDVRTRARDFINYWIKPNFRELRPESEHMIRCLMEGIQYYAPGSSYETVLIDFANIIGVLVPRVYSRLTYSQWIKHRLNRLFFDYVSKLSICRSFINRFTGEATDKANRFDKTKHEQLKNRSDKTLAAYAIESQIDRLSNSTNRKSVWSVLKTHDNFHLCKISFEKMFVIFVAIICYIIIFVSFN